MEQFTEPHLTHGADAEFGYGVNLLRWERESPRPRAMREQRIDDDFERVLLLPSWHTGKVGAPLPGARIRLLVQKADPGSGNAWIVPKRRR